MENKINLFSKYTYNESTLNADVAEDAVIIQKVRTVKKKLLTLLEKASIDSDLFRILSLYLNLNNERPEEIPSEENIEYLRIMSYRLIKLLKAQSSIPKEQLLLRLLVHLNFNKDQVIEYYINRIDNQIEDDPDNQEYILQYYWIESHYLSKKGAIYASNNHPLGAIIQNHIGVLKAHFDHQNEQAVRSTHASYPHIPRLINIEETSSLMMYGLNMLVSTDFLKIHTPLKTFFEVLSKLTRGTKNKIFEPSTLKSRFNTYNLSTLNKMGDCLEVLTEYNEYQKEMFHKRK